MMRRLARRLFALCSAASLALLLAVLLLWPLSYWREFYVASNFYYFSPEPDGVGGMEFDQRRHLEISGGRLFAGAGRIHQYTAKSRGQSGWDWGSKVDVDGGPPWTYTQWQAPTAPDATEPSWRWRALGVEYHQGGDGDIYLSRYCYIPCTYLAVLFCVLPATWLIAWQKRRRAIAREREGRCAGCGYDLTRNESGVCPECGKIPTKLSVIKAHLLPSTL